MSWLVGMKHFRISHSHISRWETCIYPSYTINLFINHKCHTEKKESSLKFIYLKK